VQFKIKRAICPKSARISSFGCPLNNHLIIRIVFESSLTQIINKLNSFWCLRKPTACKRSKTISILVIVSLNTIDFSDHSQIHRVDFGSVVESHLICAHTPHIGFQLSLFQHFASIVSHQFITFLYPFLVSWSPVISTTLCIWNRTTHFTSFLIKSKSDDFHHPQ